MSEKLKNLFFEFLVEVRTKYFKVPCDSAIFEAKAKAFLKEIVALQNTNPLHVTYLKEEFYDELLKVKHMLSDIKDNPILSVQFKMETMELYSKVFFLINNVRCRF